MIIRKTEKETCKQLDSLPISNFFFFFFFTQCSLIAIKIYGLLYLQHDYILTFILCLSYKTYNKKKVVVP